MQIRLNKKLILTYINLGIVSFCLTGCQFKKKDTPIITPTPVIQETDDDMVDIVWHIPDGYELINYNGKPCFLKTVKDTIVKTVDLTYTLPLGYKLVNMNGQKMGVQQMSDGSLATITPNITLPEGYYIKNINGKLQWVKEIEVNVLKYRDVTNNDYELPEGYEIAYIDGQFVGIKTIAENEKQLVKE